MMEEALRSSDLALTLTLLRLCRAMNATPPALVPYDVLGQPCAPKPWLSEVFPSPQVPLEGVRLLLSPLFDSAMTVHQIMQKKVSRSTTSGDGGHTSLRVPDRPALPVRQPTLNCYTLFYIQPTLYNLRRCPHTIHKTERSALVAVAAC